MTVVGMLVTDLDGTLLGPDGGVPSQVEKLNAALHARGVQLVPATSRSPHNVRELFPPHYGLSWAICSDGAAVIRLGDDGFETVSELLLNPSTAEGALRALYQRAAGRPVITAVFCGSERSFEVLLDATGGINRENLHDTFRALVADGREISTVATSELIRAAHAGCVRAISCFGDHSSVQPIADAVSPHLPQGMVSYFYEETRITGEFAWLDLHDSNVCKSTAVRYLAETMSVRQVAVLGNGANDVAALSSAYWSACPSDACSAARDVATYVAQNAGGEAFVQEIAELLVGPTLSDWGRQ